MLAEISFYDPREYTGFFNEKFIEKIGILQKSFLNIFCSAPYYEVKKDGFVENRLFKNRLPTCCRILNSPGVYTAAWALFSLTGKFLTIDVPGTDVAHWTSPLPIKLAKAKNYYTIHDVIPAKMPYTTLDNKSLYVKLINKIIKTADKIVTVSKNSRKDIVDFCPKSEKKIYNTYQSVEIPSHLIKEEKELTRYLNGVYNLSQNNYFISVGAIEPKKFWEND